ncbi:hypothetical protein Ahy_A03g012580 [Arachis hypogaea]|uniref:Uncharacterized protein n=1 Tax=Arachis hypogaea TaxID=3818 RepID=A0A445DTP1_ARAHY|nr:hypothetical protein Ahy_A03g012580 [Arachis hypogaea]
MHHRNISQDHIKLDSDTVRDGPTYNNVGAFVPPLVEAYPSIKVKSIIANVQSKFNYTINYRKVCLGKQKSITKFFYDWEVSYQPV